MWNTPDKDASPRNLFTDRSDSLSFGTKQLSS
jgi:hypothetical protein